MWGGPPGLPQVGTNGERLSPPAPAPPRTKTPQRRNFPAPPLHTCPPRRPPCRPQPPLASDAGTRCRQRQPAGNSAGPLRFDGDCWVRTLDPLIKSNPHGISTEVHDDVKLEDL